MTTQARVTTFYSYKGGVGRTSALANVAVLAAKAGRRVLAIDFDLEAPGLHRYFPPAGEARPGFIDLFYELRARLQGAFAESGRFDPDDPATRMICQAIVSSLIGGGECPYFSNGPVDRLELIYAGRFDQGYAERVQSFDWGEFFATFGEVFAILRDELCSRFDEVFIDSRTGLNDIANLSTVIFPDRLVVVFSTNEQSLHGGVEIARQAFQEHHLRKTFKHTSEDLDVVPFLCKVDPGEEKERSEWLERAGERFGALFADLLGPSDLDIGAYFRRIHVPYVSYFSYGERIATFFDKDIEKFGSVAAAYEQFFQQMASTKMQNWRPPIELPQAQADRALVLQFDAPCTLPSRFRFAATQESPAEPWAGLRRDLQDRDTLARVRAVLDEAIIKVTHDLRGELYLFGMMPYTVALLAGRRIDDLARSAPLHVYHYQMEEGQWLLFSSPEMLRTAPEAVFTQEERVVHEEHPDIVLALEGMRAISWDTLQALAGQVSAGRIVRLGQRRVEPLSPPRQTAQSVREVRRALDSLHRAHPGAAIHLVSTAPAALLVEVGRMLRPTVFRSAIMHEYVASTATYVKTIDVVEAVR